MPADEVARVVAEVRGNYRGFGLTPAGDGMFGVVVPAEGVAGRGAAPSTLDEAQERLRAVAGTDFGSTRRGGSAASRTPPGWPRATASAVEKSDEGVSSGAPEKKLGIQDSPTREVYLDNLRTPPTGSSPSRTAADVDSLAWADSRSRWGCAIAGKPRPDRYGLDLAKFRTRIHCLTGTD